MSEIRWWEFLLFGFVRGREDVRNPRLRWWRSIVVAQWIGLLLLAALAQFESRAAGASFAFVITSTVAGWVAYWRAHR